MKTKRHNSPARAIVRAACGLLALWPVLPCALLPLVPLRAQTGTQTGSGQTTISDTVRSANGSAARGTVLISWPAFTAGNGVAVQKGSTSATLGSNGGLVIALAPNAGSTPIGSFYTAVFHLSDGTVTREYWQVPASSTPVTLQAVRTAVLPSSVAVQTVSKQYVDTAIARAQFGASPAAGPAGDGSAYVEKAGDTMSGPLILSGDPTAALQAADKNYVDTTTAALQAGLDQKVSKVPTATQIVTQPANTQLRTNRLNGELHAQQFITQAGNNGIATAFAAPECSGKPCTVVVDPDYTGVDTAAPVQSGAHLVDERNGRVAETFNNPGNPSQGIARSIVSRFTAPSSGGDLFAIAQRINHTGFTGGNNLFPENYGFTLPYFKSTYSATDTAYREFTQGQHVMDTHTTDCYGVGDCILGSHYMRASGGFRDAADEGSHPFDLQITEDPRVFQGTCASGCTTGSRTLQVTATGGGGTQGSGRFLIDKAPAKVLTTGQLIGGDPGNYPAATAQFSGTSFPVSTFFLTAAAIPPQSTVMAPGTVNVAIQTSGLPSGFSGNTAASPAGSGLACVAEGVPGGSATPQNYEMANFSIVDGTHLQLTLNKPHGPGAIVAIGGLCGYGLEQTVDTFNGIRQVFPVIGTVNATNLYVASGVTSILGRSGTTGGYLNVSYDVTSISRGNGTVTVTVTNPAALDSSGVALTLSGVTDASFNGSFPMTLTASNQFQFAQGGPDASSSGGKLGVVTGGYALYPMAEVLDVYDPATADVTGKFTLAPNNVAWAANDPVEQPHYFQERVAADIEFITQYTPRPQTQQQAGIYYGGVNGPGLRGWVIANNAGGYLGSGGTHTPPDIAMQTTGIWNTALDMQAGEQAAIRLRCNSKGCGKFNSTYNLFQLDFTDGGSQYDKVTYAPQSSTMQWTLRGTQYTMSPTAMTVGTLNVTNLNAAHISGVSGSNPATSQAQGTVQLGPQATTAVLANVASSGQASDLNGLAPSATVDATGGTVLYEKSYWTDLSDFNVAGSGISVQNGKLVWNVPNNGDFSQSIALKNTSNDDDELDVETTFTLNGGTYGQANSSSAYGLAAGKLASNPEISRWGAAAFYSPFATPASVQFYLVPQGGSPSMPSGGTVANVGTAAAAQGEVVRLVYSQRGPRFYNFTHDATLQSRAVFPYEYPLNTCNGNTVPNSDYAALWNLGGNFTVQSIRVVSRKRQRPALAVIGDSKSWGCNAGMRDLRYGSQINQLGAVSVYAGSGDTTQSVLNDLANILAAKPKAVLLNIGRNDLAAGVSTPTWQGNYSSIVAQFKAAGVTVVHLLPIPETAQDQTALRNYITGTFGGDAMIDPSVNWDNATMLAPDGVHPTAAGHGFIASKILASGLFQQQAGAAYQPPLASSVLYPVQ